MVLTKRIARTFRFGERGGSFTGRTPLAAEVAENSSVNNGSRSWIKYRLPTRKPSAAPLRLRVTWLIQSPFACLASPAISTRRLDRSIEKSTRILVKPLRVQASTVEKSAAPITFRCRQRNSFQLVFRLSQPFPLVYLYPIAVSWGEATRTELSSKFDFR